MRFVAMLDQGILKNFNLEGSAILPCHTSDHQWTYLRSNTLCIQIGQGIWANHLSECGSDLQCINTDVYSIFWEYITHHHPLKEIKNMQQKSQSLSQTQPLPKSDLSLSRNWGCVFLWGGTSVARAPYWLWIDLI